MPTRTDVSCSPTQQNFGHVRPFACSVSVIPVYGGTIPGGTVRVHRGNQSFSFNARISSRYKLAPWDVVNIGSYALDASYSGYHIGKTRYLASQGGVVVTIGALVCAVPSNGDGVSWWFASSLPWWLFIVAILSMVAWILLRRRYNAASIARDSELESSLASLDDEDKEED